MLGAVRKYTPAGGRVLDFGSGRGELMQMLSQNGYKVSGCDTDDECVRLSSRFGDVVKIEAGHEAPAFADRFDCVVMSHVIEHLESPRRSLREAAALSTGRLVISVPNPYSLPYVFKALLRRRVEYVNEMHLASWDWYHFRTFVEKGCGYGIDEFFYDGVVLPAPHLVRRLLLKIGWLPPLEERFLRALFPRFCRSITAAVRV